MHNSTRLLILCALVVSSSGCVDPVADLWILKDYLPGASVDPALCSFYTNIEGYLDIDAELEGELDCSFDCGDAGYVLSADIIDISVEREDEAYSIELQFSTGTSPLYIYNCEIEEDEMTCTLTDGSETLEFKRGAWFDNSP